MLLKSTFQLYFMKKDETGVVILIFKKDCDID